MPSNYLGRFRRNLKISMNTYLWYVMNFAYLFSLGSVDELDLHRKSNRCIDLDNLWEYGSISLSLPVNIPFSIGILSFSPEDRFLPWLGWTYDRSTSCFNNIFSPQRANSNFPHLWIISLLSTFFQLRLKIGLWEVRVSGFPVLLSTLITYISLLRLIFKGLFLDLSIWSLH
jgi:hypothetical protein